MQQTSRLVYLSAYLSAYCLHHADCSLYAAITAGYEPQSPSNQDSVQAANGPTPTSESSSEQTLFMADGLKLQQLHTAQWGLDRIDQQYRPLNQTFM